MGVNSLFINYLLEFSFQWKWFWKWITMEVWKFLVMLANKKSRMHITSWLGQNRDSTVIVCVVPRVQAHSRPHEPVMRKWKSSTAEFATLGIPKNENYIKKIKISSFLFFSFYLFFLLFFFCCFYSRKHTTLF